jgi:hypothetical protein
MNAAVDTSRSENQRRRPHSLAHKRGGQNDVDASQPLAVLIRVPNLDAPRPTPRAATKPEAKPETALASETAKQAATKAKTNNTATTARTPAASKAGSLVGWVWRMMILAAAVGLVWLAYRIINGPANLPQGEPAPASANIVAESKDTNSSTPPAQLAPHASDIAAPSTLAPPKLELETPPVQVTPVDAGETQPPASATENIADRTGEAPSEDRRPWATGVRMEQPRGDDSIRTAEAPNYRRDYEPQDQQYQDSYQDQYYDNYESTDQGGANYDYPETSPNTYRAEGQWESTPRGAAPRGDASSYVPPPSSGASQYSDTGPNNGSQYNGWQYGAPQTSGTQYNNTGNPAWSDPAHSAMRPRDPGVARLRGEIEQPPLRRDDERNRPGVY